jgi:uncharacterized protein (DUF1810 family)
MTNNLQHFIIEQGRKPDYDTALAEIKSGRKQTHWIWFIFPQLAGLYSGSMSQRFAIADLDEATAYFQHDLLGHRLVEISTALLGLSTNNAGEVFDKQEDVDKLQSSMTLFALVPNVSPVFQAVLDKYFSGRQDEKTIELLLGNRQNK